MQHQDWNNVTWHKPPRAEKNVPKTSKSFTKLDSDDPDPPKKISHNLKTQIQQARMAKGMSKKDLASKLNIKEIILTKYENGTIVPEKQLLRRLAILLNTKLYM